MNCYNFDIHIGTFEISFFRDDAPDSLTRMWEARKRRPNGRVNIECFLDENPKYATVGCCWRQTEDVRRPRSGDRPTTRLTKWRESIRFLNGGGGGCGRTSWAATVSWSESPGGGTGSWLQKFVPVVFKRILTERRSPSRGNRSRSRASGCCGRLTVYYHTAPAASSSFELRP